MRRWFLLGLFFWTLACQARVAPKTTVSEAWLALKPMPNAFGGGRLVLAHLNDRRLGLLADPEERRVHLLDLDEPGVIATHPFEGRPEALVVAPGGAIWVIDRETNALVELGLARNEVLVERRRITTAPEPVGLGVSPDGRLLFVSSRGDASLEEIPVASPEDRTSSNTGAEPRGVTVLDSGTPIVGRANTRRDPLFLVAHTEEKLWSPPTTRTTIKREELRNQEFAPVTDGVRAFAAFDRLDRDEPKSVNGAKESSFGYGGPTAPSLQGHIEVLESERSESRALSNCLLPRAAAFDRVKSTIYVACAGTDSVASVQIHPGEIEPEPVLDLKETVEVPDGPFGLALDSDVGAIWVWSEFARAVSVIRGNKSRVLLEIARAAGHDDALARGRRLFHTANERRISKTGFACASCHPDGGDDAQVWPVKDGTTSADFLRQTPTLAGRVGFTERFGWRGEDTTLEAHLTRTIRRLEGDGITESERDDLAAYVRSLRDTVRAPRALTSLQSKGRELFRSEDLGCNSCHTDLGSRGGTMGILRAGGPLRSPSLRSVSRTAPYFHDGSEETLEGVLEFKVKALQLSVSPEQSEALLAYLGTL